MQKLTVIYKEVEKGLFNATVIQYPNIFAYRWKGLDECKDAIYHLVFEELQYMQHKEWSISKEIIIYKE